MKTEEKIDFCKNRINIDYVNEELLNLIFNNDNMFSKYEDIKQAEQCFEEEPSKFQTFDMKLFFAKNILKIKMKLNTHSIVNLVKEKRYHKMITTYGINVRLEQAFTTINLEYEIEKECLDLILKVIVFELPKDKLTNITNLWYYLDIILKLIINSCEYLSESYDVYLGYTPGVIKDYSSNIDSLEEVKKHIKEKRHLKK